MSNSGNRPLGRASSVNWLRRCALAGCLSVLACSDSTGPKVPFDVAITAVVTSEQFNEVAHRRECRFTLTATASGGKPNQAAAWIGLTGSNRPDDGGVWESFSGGFLEVLNWWGTSFIKTGEQQTANRITWGSDGPFFTELTFQRLLDGGEEFRSVTVFTC